VLEDVGLIRHEPDAFRRNRSAYRIAEPLVAFYHSVMRPYWGDLERPGRGQAVWESAQSMFRGKILGPHFENLCRDWSRWHAAPNTHGGYPSRVAAGTVNEPAARTSHEIDVAVFGQRDSERETLLAIGEAKWNETMGVGHLQRLDHVRRLLQARHVATDETDPHLLCFSGNGFTPELREAAADDPTVQLIDLEHLYHGQ
jgi:hypothetical protein